MAKDQVSLEELFVRYLDDRYSVADFQALQQYFGTEANEEDHVDHEGHKDHAELTRLVLAAMERNAMERDQNAETSEVSAETAATDRIDRVVARLDARMAADFPVSEPTPSPQTTGK